MMLAEISQKVFEILRDDTILQGLLPNVHNNTNIVEMRAPVHSEESNYPIVVYRVRSAAALPQPESLNVLSWFIEIDVLDNDQDTTDAWAVVSRIYRLLEDREVVPGAGDGIVLRCKLDFFDTASDDATLVNFFMMRFNIYSLEQPSSKIGNLG